MYKCLTSQLIYFNSSQKIVSKTSIGVLFFSCSFTQGPPLPRFFNHTLERQKIGLETSKFNIALISVTQQFYRLIYYLLPAKNLKASLFTPCYLDYLVMQKIQESPATAKTMRSCGTLVFKRNIRNFTLNSKSHYMRKYRHSFQQKITVFKLKAVLITLFFTL